MSIYKDTSIIESTWANRGSAVSRAGKQIYITDLGIVGYSDNGYGITP